MMNVTVFTMSFFVYLRPFILKDTNWRKVHCSNKFTAFFKVLRDLMT